MTKNEFLAELETLLGDVPSDERNEALSYYREYFEDAGEGMEEKVLEELVTPAKVAALIKENLNGNEAVENGGVFTETGYQESTTKPGKQELERINQVAAGGSRGAGDTTENKGNENLNNGGRQNGYKYNDGQGQGGYGQGAPDQGRHGQNAANQGGYGQNAANQGGYGQGAANQGGYGQGAPNQGGYGQNGSNRSGNTQNTSNQNTYTQNGYGQNQYNRNGNGQNTAGANYSQGSVKKPMNGGLKAFLIVMTVIFFIPACGLAIGLMGVVIGVAAAIGSICLAFFLVTIALTVAGTVMVVTGIANLFSIPPAGVLLIGSGLLLFGIGLMFLMLTVFIAGRLIPQIVKGMVALVKLPFQGRDITTG